MQRACYELLTRAPGGERLVDLRGVRFFDVNALCAFLSGADAASTAHVPLRLAASPHVDRVFQVLGIEIARPECPSVSVDVDADGDRSDA